MRALKIDAEFAAFLPAPESFEALEELIVSEGCLDPIRVWAGKDVIVDGHTRYKICVKHSVKFKTVEIEFENRDAVYAWMAATQLSRRNLTDEQRAYYIGKMFLAESGTHGGARRGEAAESRGRTAERIAKAHEVSPATVKNSAEFAKNLDEAGEKAPEFKEHVLKKRGKVTRRQVEDVAKDKPEAAKKRAAKIIAGEKEEATPPTASPKVFDGDGKEVKDPRYVEVFSDREGMVAALKTAKGLRATIKRLALTPGGSNVHVEETVASCNLIVQEIEDRTPRCRCTVCKGEKMDAADRRKECPACGGSGWLDNFMHGLVTSRRRKS